MTTILEKFQGCLAGVFAGDMLGMPWEIKTHEEILAATNGQGVTGLQDSPERYFQSLRCLKLGDTTDDWQLTRAITESLIENRGYNFDDIVKRHIFEMDRTTAGWGRSTTRSIKDIKKFFIESDGRQGRDPHQPLPLPEPGLNKGAGNGVAMKIAPIALFYALKYHEEPGFYERLLEQIMELGSMTHGDPRASLAAYAVALVIESVLFESFSNECLVKAIDLFSNTLRLAEQKYRLKDRDSFYFKLIRILEFDLWANLEKMRQEIGTSCYCLESVPFSISIFLHYPNDFRAGVFEAINAGGDTDTNAAMVGAMIGANVGIKEIPREWANKTAIELGEQLYQVALST